MEIIQSMKKYDNYKDSGVEWIGEIPSHWDFTKLKYVLTIQSGKGITNEQFIENGEFEIYGGNGILGLTNNYSHDGIDLVIGRVGALCGNIRLIKGKKWISDNALVANTSQNYDFIETCLRFLDLNKLANKNAQPLITGTMVKEQYIALPPLQEQTAIANFLDHKTSQIDHLIAKKEKFIKLLEEERVAVINQAVTKGLDPNVPMKDSGVEWLGDIPEHWEVKQVRYLLKEGKEGIKIGPFGSALKLDFMTNSGYKVYGQENVIKNDFTRGFKYIDEAKYEEMINYTITPGDIVITMMGTAGLAKVVPMDIEKGIMDSHLTRVRVDSIKFNNSLFELLINDSYLIKSQVQFHSKGAIMSGLNSTIIKSFALPLPSIEEQVEIVQYIELKTIEIDTLVSKANEEINLLKEYKTALISEVVTGKVDVRSEILN